MRNCILDAGDPGAWAICAASATDGQPGGHWIIENCTVIGRVSVRGLDLASNSILYGKSVSVERRQEGCVRFTWLPAKAVVPRRYKCVPRTDTDASGKEFQVRAEPQFVSRLFGDAGYCQLRVSCPDPVRRGADDEGEMGVWHDLLEPRREAHLRSRLDQYLRFSMEAGIFHARETPNINVGQL